LSTNNREEIAMNPLPVARQEELQTPYGPVMGASYRWQGGQYCALHATRGLVGCGIFDIHTANEFGQAVAIARGTPADPLCEPEDLYHAKIVGMTDAAAKMGVRIGMTGLEAVGKMIAADGTA
jgi:uncharacterized protein YunC (DUF1805 family)